MPIPCSVRLIRFEEGLGLNGTQYSSIECYNILPQRVTKVMKQRDEEIVTDGGKVSDTHRQTEIESELSNREEKN